MSEPRLIGDIIADILADLKEHDMDAVFEREWTDVTDFLKLPTIKGVDLEIKIGTGCVDSLCNNGRIYCKKSDLEKFYGTSDFSVKIRNRRGR